ncbi:trigger factor [Desulfopila inferna]|uniref:trigger factor n=1 Tax=Desulfopila inferna TaxID=468528 RepID=UPI0019626F05|nr:trigger factor [Desulfopila inferna]MBM9603029.1 trigger factor [Desulfopila inferna]
MDVKVEEIGTLTRKVTVTLPETDVRKKLKKAYDKLQRESKMKGFRRGKVPRSIIEKSYKPQVEAEVGEKLVQDTYFDVIEKENIDAVIHPEILNHVYNEDGSFTYEAQVDVRPQFEVTGYKELEVERPQTDVTDEDVDKEIENLRRQMAPLKSSEDRPAEEGDIVIIDYQGFHKGNPMKQVKNENTSVEVGAGQMGEEFEKKLVGMSKDQEASHEVEFPEKHPNPILAGKTIEFKVTIKDIKERILAELDDEFAKDVGKEFNTLEELKTAIREKLTREREESAEGQLTDRIMQAILKENEFEVPKKLVDFEVEQMIKQTEEQLEKSGMNLEAAGLNREMLAQRNEPVAAQRVRGDFILKKIAEKEEIKLKDEDMDRGFKRIGDQYNMPVAQVKEFFGNRDDLLPLMNELLNEKVLDFLRKEVKYIEPEAAPVEEEQTPEGS